MPAPPITGFSHISLSVTDLEKSLRFYRDLLGLSILREPYDGTVFEGREALLLVGRRGLGLQQHRGNTGEMFDPLHPGLDHISFSVESLDDLQAFADHLAAAGLQHSGVTPLPDFGH